MSRNNRSGRECISLHYSDMDVDNDSKVKEELRTPEFQLFAVAAKFLDVTILDDDFGQLVVGSFERRCREFMWQ